MKGGIVLVNYFETELGGRKLIVETGKVAKQAGGAAVIRYGDTVVLVTATSSKDPREGIDFFPLTVDYEERQYAAGKIPGGFIKREGRPTDFATLTARLIDRPLRPLFPKGYRNDVQVVATVMSVEMDNPADISAMLGASVALGISNIPFLEPVAGVTVGMIDGQFIINPTIEQNAKSDMHLIVAGTKEAIMMVEAGANEVPENIMLDAMLFAHEEIQKLVIFQEKIIAEVGVEKAEVKVAITNEEIQQAVRAYAYDKIDLASRNEDKHLRQDKVDEINQETIEFLKESYPENTKEIKTILEKILKEIVRKMMIEDGERVDGRKLSEIRKVSCELGYLARPHGSALFTRGQTQVLSVTTLGALGEEQILDGIGAEKSKRYIHHYNFPAFSVGEARSSRGPGRREIGHGALAERALVAVLPSVEEFPYTIRVVSDVLESNGSTSMGSVCGSSLSLMHAGVPIKASVSGIAMGLVKEGDKFAILSDIQGIEDALGDMDFKVAGTAKGITALQMDMKISGVSREIIEQSLKQAGEGRMYIMGVMNELIQEPKEELSPYAPRMIKMKVPTDKIREIIGAGGKTIQKIVAETGCKIDIEDSGNLIIVAVDGDAGQKAKSYIEAIIAQVEVGRIYNGTVKRVMDFGAFVEIIPGVLGTSGKEGLVHISQLAEDRVNKVNDVVDVGDKILVKVMEIDQQGRVNLSRKAALRHEQEK